MQSEFNVSDIVFDKMNNFCLGPVYYWPPNIYILERITLLPNLFYCCRKHNLSGVECCVYNTLCEKKGLNT